MNSYRKSPQNEKFAKPKDDYENKTTLKKDSSVELEMLITINNDAVSFCFVKFYFIFLERS